MKYYILIFILISSFCNEAKFNHPAEGAGGMIIGIYQKKSSETISIIIANQPETITEGATLPFAVRLSQKVNTNYKLTISSDNDALLINDKRTETLDITSENSDKNNSINLIAPEDSNLISETITINVTGDGLQPASFPVKVSDTISRKIQIITEASLIEEANGNVKVNIGIKPERNVTVYLTSSDQNTVKFTNTSVSFTPENYNIQQNISFSINDALNENIKYTIIGTSDSETNSSTISLTDTDFQFKDISANSEEHSGYNPSPVIDKINNNLVVATKKFNPLVNTETKLYIYKANLNGDNSNKIYYPSFDFSSAPSSGNSILYPQLILNDSLNKIYTITAFGGIGFQLFDCNLDILNCSKIRIDNIISGVPKSIFYNQTLYLYWGNNYDYGKDGPFPAFIKDYNASINFSNSTYSSFFDIPVGALPLEDVFPCYIDTTYDCFYDITKKDISNYGSRGAAHDIKNSKLLSVYTGKSTTTSYIPVIKRTNLSGSLGLETFYISSTYQSGITPDMKIDTLNDKVIITAINHAAGGKVWYFRCNLDITGCEEKDISTGKTAFAFFPKLNIDLVNQKLWVISYDDSYKLYAIQCNLDGTNCKSKDISFGYQVAPSSEEYNFDSIIDTVNNRLIVVFTDKATGKLSMVRFGLGGF